MILSLDMGSEVPIYVQLRNQIVTGIGKGELAVGERLPTVRQLAQDAGVNVMTVNKTYQLLKLEGFIEIDRRKGAIVCPIRETQDCFREKLVTVPTVSFFLYPQPAFSSSQRVSLHLDRYKSFRQTRR